jgi:ribosome-associated protein
MRLMIPANELSWTAIRAQGPGGQNVNKTACAVHLRFDIHASSLPEAVRTRLLQLTDQRISRGGVVNIKAQEYRSLEKNRSEALRRLYVLIEQATRVPACRRPTRPTRRSVSDRLEGKARRGVIKAGRGKIRD